MRFIIVGSVMSLSGVFASSVFDSENPPSAMAVEVSSRHLTDADMAAPPSSVSFPVVSRNEGELFSGPGGDNCDDAAVVNVTVGSPGSPNTVTILGDNTNATPPADCSLGGGDFGWWEAFQIDKCAKVTIDFCGQDPVSRPSYVFLFDSCPCGADIVADAFGRNGQYCPDPNIGLVFNALAPGTYYYPVLSRPIMVCENNGAACTTDDDCIGDNQCVSPLHPYEMHITAEECTQGCGGCFGSCCNPLFGTCVDDVMVGACGDPGTFSRRRCCELSCGTTPPPDTYESQDMNLLGRVPLTSYPSNPGSANDVWGYTSPHGRRYAIIGLDDGTGFVDITNTRHPEIVADIPDTFSFWSDFKCHNGFCYNGNESGGGVQIIDVRDIDNGIVTLTGALTQNGLNTTHTIAVNPASGYLYLNGSNLANGRLIAVSLADPANPTIVGQMNEAVYVHDSFITSYTSGPYAGKEIAFCFCGGAGMKIVDVTNKSNMFTMATLAYPTRSYSHQGWITDDKKYIFMDDELDEVNGFVSEVTTYIVDVQNLSLPMMADTFSNGACNIDHDLIVNGNRVYQAHYSRGMRVLDATDPLNVSEVAYFDTHPESNIQDFVGAWGSYAFPSRISLISDIERGLFVLCDRVDKPIPSFFVTPQDEACGMFLLDATLSTHCTEDVPLVDFEWDFDYNGLTFDVEATGALISHTFHTIDTFNVALRLRDGFGMAEIMELKVTRVTQDCPCLEPELVATNPPNGANDARQPTDLDGTNPRGFNSIQLAANDACVLESTTTKDFSVRECPSAGAVPSVVGLDFSDGQTKVTVVLSAPIDPGKWTCIKHVPTGIEKCLARLPADASGDRNAGAGDIISLINHLNGVGVPLPIYSCDIDWSGQCGAPDIIRLIDLLNGASAFDPWLGVALLPLSFCEP